MESETEDATGMRIPIGVSDELVGLREQKTAGTSSLDFDGLLYPPLLEMREDVKEGCGGQLWPAGMVLAKYLLRSPQLKSLRGKRILELGAGSGLVGLAVACALRNSSLGLDGGTSIHMTDQEPLIPLLQQNIQLNRFSDHQVTGGVLDWGSPIDDSYTPDIILAAESCYFCFKKRRKADLRLMKEARKMFRVEDVTDDPDRDRWSREGLFMYKITRKP